MSNYRTSLVDAWDFAEGAGSVAHGRLGIDLALSRAERNNASVLPAESGWLTESYPSAGGRNTYNGAALANLSAGTLLANDGDVVTIAWRFWYGGGQIMDGYPWPSELPAAYADLLGMGGFYIAGDTGTLTGLRFFDTNGPADDAGVLIMQGYPSGGVFGDVAWNLSGKGDPPYTPRLLVVEFTRDDAPMSGGPFARARFGTSGAFQGGPVDYLLGDLDLTRVMFGSHYYCFGSFAQAAIWTRALTDDEMAELGDDLDPVFEEIDEHDDPLIDDDGRARLVFGHDNPRVFDAIVVRTERPEALRREVRRVTVNRPRVYTMNVPLGTAAEFARLVQAISDGAGSCQSLRFSHPVDDPLVPADQAEKWRILNGDSLELSRDPAGTSFTVALVMEKVL